MNNQQGCTAIARQRRSYRQGGVAAMGEVGREQNLFDLHDQPDDTNEARTQQPDEFNSFRRGATRLF